MYSPSISLFSLTGALRIDVRGVFFFSFLDYIIIVCVTLLSPSGQFMVETITKLMSDRLDFFHLTGKSVKKNLYICRVPTVVCE